MRKYNLHIASLLVALLLSFGVVAADSVPLNPSHPDRYEVVKGDTLWDIAGRFLRDPWRWPDVWQVNPQIANPHLIFPGDIIALSYVDGQPRLSLQRRGSLVKLSPQVRESEISNAIPAIPIDAIHQFLTRPYVLDAKQINSAPYVVSFGTERLLGDTSSLLYVRAIDDDRQRHFDIVRPGPPYRDADTGETLGFEAAMVGGGDLRNTGDPATVVMNRMELEAVIGDRLLPDVKDIPITSFMPKAPDQPVRGSIISVLNGVSQIGQYNVVALDRGAKDGLMPGDVLAINMRGAVVRDTVADNGQRVRLPDEPAGMLMVFRVFPRVSFALVMYATRAIHVRDRVVNP